MDTPACRICARPHEPDTPDASAWTHEPDGDRRLCPACTRTHVRDIESRLPDEWWAG